MDETERRVKWPGRAALVERRMRWGLTWRAYLLGLAVVGVCVLLTVKFAYAFLAVCDVVPGDTLVVEGWMPDTELPAIRQAFDVGHYRRLFLTGGPLLKSDPMNRYMTYPDLMMVQLLDRGFSVQSLVAVPAPWSARDRTYVSALALREWFEKHGGAPSGINVLTLGPHARRTRLMFENAFRREVKVGVIPIASADFDPERWWASSNGVRTVLSEGIAYLYARIVFQAEKPSHFAALTAL